jgi:hypothetical protein
MGMAIAQKQHSLGQGDEMHELRFSVRQGGAAGAPVSRRFPFHQP